MRILRVRGGNIASLTTFDVPFDSGLLDGSGVFAITGPTGAGKSTLLDAICLALFGTTSRLHGGGNERVGREDEDEDHRLTTQDPRNLLRKGTGEGFAEVDFRGVDRRRYRARWEVRRAGGRPTGRIQDQKLSLTDAETDERIGRNKGEVLTAVADRLGLSFDQFRRSVLLPQGDFAAFLEADEKERAALLERITGTEIYTEISKLAHSRWSDGVQELNQKRKLRDSIVTMTDEEKAEAQDREKMLREHQAEAKQNLEKAKTDLRWHETAEQLRSREIEAQKALKEATRRFAEADEKRAEVDAVDRAQSARGRVEALDAAATRVAEAEGRHQSAATDEKTAKKQSAAADKTFSRAKAHSTKVEERRAAAQPDLKGAAKLDAQLATTDKALAKVTDEAETAEDLAEQARVKAEEAEDALAGWREQLAESQDWLQRHTKLSTLGQQWDRWNEQLQRYTAAHAEHEEAVGARDGLATDEEESREALDGLQEELKESGEALKKARAEVKRADTAAGRFDVNALREEQRAANAQQRLLDEAKQISSEARRTAAAAERDEKTAASSRAKAEKARARSTTAAEQAEQHRLQLIEAERAAEDAQAAANATELRDALEPGKPCPVCGSVEHPWADETPHFSKLAERQKAGVAELRAKLSATEQQAILQRGEANSLASQADEAQHRAKEMHRDLRKLERRWAKISEKLEDHELPMEPADKGSHEAVVALAADVKAALAEVEAQLQAADAARDEAGSASDALSELQQEIDALSALADNAKNAHQEAAIALKENNQTADRLYKELCTIEERVEPALSGTRAWKTRLRGDPDHFVEALTDQAGTWRSHNDALQAAQKELAAGEPRAKADAASADAAETGAKAVAKRRDEAAAEQQRLSTERKKLFKGRAVADVEAELKKATEAATAKLEAARSAAEQAHGRAKETRAVLNEATKASEKAVREHAKLQEALEKTLQKIDCNEKALRVRLQHGAEWVAEQRDALDKLKTAQTEAAAVRTERQTALAKHQSTDEPELDHEQTERKLKETTEAVEQLGAKLKDVELELRSDTNDRKKRERLNAEIAAEEKKTQVWRQLRELIGSSDGSKFSRFAQSLSLELLLGHANHRLKELTTRYSLQRVPGASLVLQIVDHDMGDEVRSTKSLSGGESFLVSLALALGLATLSSSKTQVESLFIDEGFGTLDTETLDTVIAALDALRATNRQIGVVSHVASVAERVGVQVHVQPRGPGRSEVSVRGV